MLMSGRKSHVEGQAAVDFCGEAEATSCHSPVRAQEEEGI